MKNRRKTGGIDLEFPEYELPDFPELEFPDLDLDLPELDLDLPELKLDFSGERESLKHGRSKETAA